MHYMHYKAGGLAHLCSVYMIVCRLLEEVLATCDTKMSGATVE